ncbi:DNA repair protein RecO [Gloeothece citriformis PCC 7424]|uniref:DNA repair protein RecO n=1 Tax=Gloeothece citriformis (strain PCC 7424) TaxID=65393 RepID=RECO_GLOC7|nr:DNA repair protein RecO [Gloeothece citriformis]B7K8P1.1 RecName: Full=DNA repair protein RecO; AltName: Full=Recombination protein O [Gloeothece citriformis PCC 7424]ACK71239.1 DNA repair protein RecO [Gloeothece citriformis PCC 7424]
MSKTYQATGIILKGMPLGEADRLVTILTSEYGLIQAVVPGARKHKSRLRGRSELFVVNQLLIVKGRSLDKLIQAETLESYPGLSRDLGKLTASQYLAELVLSLALCEQPQIELYELLNEHLRRIEQKATPQTLYPHLAQAVFHLLAIAGVAPQVYQCCLSREPIETNFIDSLWRVGFSFESGGAINLSSDRRQPFQPSDDLKKEIFLNKLNWKLTAVELTLLQQLGQKFLPQAYDIFPMDVAISSIDVAWIKIERILREYAQYHFGRSFRSATLVDTLAPVDF